MRGAGKLLKLLSLALALALPAAPWLHGIEHAHEAAEHPGLHCAEADAHLHAPVRAAEPCESCQALAQAVQLPAAVGLPLAAEGLLALSAGTACQPRAVLFTHFDHRGPPSFLS